ncbi:MAG: CRISPR-associated endonuclease Cas3'', partial [Candidatus Latescibacterota bacterium]
MVLCHEDGFPLYDPIEETEQARRPSPVALAVLWHTEPMQHGMTGRGSMSAFAHSLPGKPDRSKWQCLAKHLEAVAEKAGEFAESFSSTDWAWNAGWLHDIGKAADEFQAYLLRENGLDDSEYDGIGGSRVNHSSAGAALAEERFAIPNCPLGLPLAYIAAGHHAGLPVWFEVDTGRAALRLRLEEGRRNLEHIRAVTQTYEQNLRPITRLPFFVKREQFHLWVRMLFSCLTDADSLDTEAFMQPEQARQRTPFPPLTELKTRLDWHLSDLAAKSDPTPVNLARLEVLAACRAAAAEPPGLFSLTVPTGGGKTLSGMAFALDHAVRHGKKRVIYVIPYTSIVEQTADTLAKVFGPENVVEHHSNLDPDKETPRSRLAADNWDAPIVITTNVQFFESLYSARPGRCRKLHNVVNSVVLLDEAQLLPPELLTPCVDAMNQLVRHYGVTMALATATQPALPGLEKPREIVADPPALYLRLRRTKYFFPAPTSEPTTWEALAARLQTHEQVLCVVNTRKDCHDLFS